MDPGKARSVGRHSHELFKKAQELVPGGVHSPVRSFRAVQMEPLFLRRGQGAHVWDADGRRYIDYVGSWGALLFGHAHPKIVEAVQSAASRGTSFGMSTEAEVQLVSRVLELVPGLEMLRLVNSGTEATLSAVRLARAVTQRNKILKFAGCYHGHADSFLIQAGSGMATLPASPGITPATVADTLLAEYNDLDQVSKALDAHAGQVACVIVEPVAGNMGVVPPEPGFLQGLRNLCDEHGSLLILDEVITGFRLAPGGAQEKLGVRPDLATFGKVLGGGLPVGAYGGKRKFMREVAPSGSVYQAGTLAGNPIAVAAGLACLQLLQENQGIHAELEKRSRLLEDGIRQQLARLSLPVCFQRVGSMWTLFFQPEPVHDFASASRCDTTRFARFFQCLLERGVLIAPSQFETCFVSMAHDESILESSVAAIGSALEEAFS